MFEVTGTLIPPQGLPLQVGAVVGLLGSLAVGLLSPQIFGVPGVAWTWNVFVGAVITFVVGVAVSPLTHDEAVPIRLSREARPLAIP